METKHHTPSVIAKLMGFDQPQPQQPIHKQQRVLSENYLQKIASIGLREKRSFYEGRSFKRKNEKQQGFRDVFEVAEISKKDNPLFQSVPKEKATSRTNDAKMACMRQNFTDAKCPLLDEKLRYPKEIDYVLEDLDYSKDILLRYLKRRDSYYTSHLRNLPKYRNNEKCRKSEKVARGNVLRPLQKLESGSIIDTCGDLNIDYLHNLLKSQLELKDETCHSPTRIVVLKPYSEKAKNAAKSSFLRSSCPSSQSGDMKQEYPRPVIGELCNEVRNNEHPVNDMEPSRHGFRLSSGIAKDKEIIRQIKHRINRSSTEVSRSEVTVDGTTVNEPEMMTPSCANFFDRKNQEQTSYSSLNGSSFAREAKERHSERWKITQVYQEVGSGSRGCTLGEMLAMPDQETRSRNLNYKLDTHRLCSQFSLDGGNSELGSPLGIETPKLGTRNQAFHNGRCLRPEEADTKGGNKLRNQHLLEKDRSKPRQLIFRCEKSQSSSYVDLGNNQTVQETQMNMDELENKLEEECVSEEKIVVSKLSNCSIPCSDSNYNQPSPGTQVIQDEPENSFENNISKHSEDSSTVLNWSINSFASISMATDEENEDVTFSCVGPDGQQPDPMACNMFMKEGHSCSNGGALTGQELSIGSPEGGLISSNCTRIDPEFPKSLGEGHQPSPNSVLETPFKEEVVSGSECFEKVSAELHGLWMQLQLLKSEAEEPSSEGPSMVVSSDEESVDYSKENGKLARFFTTEESRDFNYLVDLLNEMGLQGGNLEISLEKWHSPECPINPSVFEVLEKKYGELKSWKKPERRLLFDRINSGLVEILQPYMAIHMWATPLRTRISDTLRNDVSEEDLWMFMVSQGNEVSNNLSEKAMGREKRWLELGDDIDFIAKEIENFLFDDLAAELASVESF